MIYVCNKYYGSILVLLLDQIPQIVTNLQFFILRKYTKYQALKRKKFLRQNNLMWHDKTSKIVINTTKSSIHC